ncbi:MSMEG_0567/Sll0786 family nitrogen starvation N-acetyltransferase [Roseibium sp. HPY-6]|uniref:MSMEG_0567/Sll0786 family nitrogen starvation N-acetyltransferase n=1 Tax=Roseibium sp. HPY-6 TaxID=3229852 RepID=UPI00338FFF37
MLEFSRKTFLSPQFAIKAASAPWEFAGATALRLQVFCEEQEIFEGHDRDAIDHKALPLVAVSTLAGEADEVVGTVRIHEESPGTWWGSRLAVAKTHRRVGRLGAELIRLAVSSANGFGCDRFFAHVQEQNVRFFERLHWVSLEPVDIHGKRHMKMEANLAAYPAFKDPSAGWTMQLRGR